MEILNRGSEVKGGVVVITSTIQDKMTLQDLKNKKALIEREEGNVDRQINQLQSRKANLAEDKAFVEECIQSLTPDEGVSENGK